MVTKGLPIAFATLSLLGACGGGSTPAVPFPKGFLWGVSTAAEQSEGGITTNDWYVFETLGKVPAVGMADDFWDLYDTDAANASQALGANEFRLTFEWARVVPKRPADVTAPLTAADVDMTAVAHYKAIIASLKAHGLTPLVTLTHYTLPQWVDNPAAFDAKTKTYTDGSLGGWTNPETALAFASYAAFMAQQFSPSVTYWLTENEPVVDVLTGYMFNQWPPGFLNFDLNKTTMPNGASVAAVLRNMIDGHARAYHAIKAVEPGALVSLAKNSIATTPLDPTNPADVAAAARWDAFYNLLFLDGITKGTFDTSLVGTGPFEMHSDWAATADFIGVNYYAYDPVVPTCGLPGPVDAIPCDPAVEGQFPLTSLGCPTTNPSEVDGLEKILDEYAARYGLPIFITENGSGSADANAKAAYIVQNSARLGQLIASGVKILGYSYWTLNYDYEWSEGYGQNFGLFDVKGFGAPGFSAPNAMTDFTRVPLQPAVDVYKQIASGNAVSGSLIDQYPATSPSPSPSP